MLRPDNSLREEPVAKVEDDGSNVDEHLRRDSQANVSRVARPCYSHGHCD